MYNMIQIVLRYRLPRTMGLLFLQRENINYTLFIGRFERQLIELKKDQQIQQEWTISRTGSKDYGLVSSDSAALQNRSFGSKFLINVFSYFCLFLMEDVSTIYSLDFNLNTWMAFLTKIIGTNFSPPQRRIWKPSVSPFPLTNSKTWEFGFGFSSVKEWFLGFVLLLFLS